MTWAIQNGVAKVISVHAAIDDRTLEFICIGLIPAPDDYFTDRILRMTSGLDNGLAMEVSDWFGAGASAVLFKPFPFAVGSRFLVSLHETAVADHVGSENGGKAAFRWNPN